MRIPRQVSVIAAGMTLITSIALLQVPNVAFAAPAGHQTALSMTFMNAANSAPMAGARVLVFFNPPAPNMHAEVTLPQIGSGMTDSTGAVNLTLNTAAVPAPPSLMSARATSRSTRSSWPGILPVSTTSPTRSSTRDEP